MGEKHNQRLVMGIESSCDETAVAVVREDRAVLSNEILSQIEEHQPYGGVVPEIAARAHLQNIDALVRQALHNADISMSDLDGVAATGGPGLIGGVIVGVMTAKAIAAVHDIPFIAVNHLEGHALTARLTDDIDFPFLLLLVSGGHCQLLEVEGVGTYRRLGTTMDDAVGEAFDKTAKLLDLPYPGGPSMEKAADGGDAERFDLPRPMYGKPGCDFSFSGLKTAVRQKIDAAETRDSQFVSDISASFHKAVGASLKDRCKRAMAQFRERHGSGHPFVVAGGVAANSYLRQVLSNLCAEEQFQFHAPPVKLCTDNGAMIAWAGLERLRLGDVDSLEFAPRPRWPLDPDAPKAGGAGVKA